MWGDHRSQPDAILSRITLAASNTRSTVRQTGAMAGGSGRGHEHPIPPVPPSRRHCWVAVEAVTATPTRRRGASTAFFLIADMAGGALVRMSHGSSDSALALQGLGGVEGVPRRQDLRSSLRPDPALAARPARLLKITTGPLFAGQALSPVLLVRGDVRSGLPAQIADGYHRVCANYLTHENCDIPVRIIDVPGTR